MTFGTYLWNQQGVILNSFEKRAFNRAVEVLGYTSKHYLNKQEILKLVAELEAGREYGTADKVRSADSALIADWLRG
jgi:hypothetical protein